MSAKRKVQNAKFWVSFASKHYIGAVCKKREIFVASFSYI